MQLYELKTFLRQNLQSSIFYLGIVKTFVFFRPFRKYYDDLTLKTIFILCKSYELEKLNAA